MTDCAEILETSAGVALLRPRILQHEGVVAAMSTRVIEPVRGQFGCNISFKVGDDPEGVRHCRERVFLAAGVRESDVVLPGQVHGDCIVAADAGGRYEACDGVITARRGLTVAVTVADCVPVLILDPNRRIVAAVHAGWRGSMAGIVAKAIARLVHEHGCRPEELLAYIGPSAGVCCYEVGEEVAAVFPAKYITPSESGGRKLDLKTFNRDQLIAGGMPAGAVSVSGYCTICSQELFHSYRRDRSRSGRMIALLGLARGKSSRAR